MDRRVARAAQTALAILLSGVVGCAASMTVDAGADLGGDLSDGGALDIDGSDAGGMDSAVPDAGACRPAEFRLPDGGFSGQCAADLDCVFDRGTCQSGLCCNGTVDTSTCACACGASRGCALEQECCDGAAAADMGVPVASPGVLQCRDPRICHPGGGG
jgi:hypothetical protein